MLLAAVPCRAAEYRPLPLSAPIGLTSDWLIHDAGRNRLILYLPGYHAPVHVYYQYVRLRHGQPFPIAFIAQQGLSLFLDNQLVFIADQARPYELDLARLQPSGQAPGAHLLGVWQPGGSPALASFTAGPALAPVDATPDTAAEMAQVRLPDSLGENILLSFLLVLGLLYGGVRATYQPGLARVFQFDELFGNSSDQGAFLARPAFSLLNIILVVLFGLSFALLLTALHAGLENIPLVWQFVVVPGRAVVLQVLLYAALIAGFVLGKYLYISPACLYLRSARIGGSTIPRIFAHHPASRTILAVCAVALSGSQRPPPHCRGQHGCCRHHFGVGGGRIAGASYRAPARVAA